MAEDNSDRGGAKRGLSRRGALRGIAALGAGLAAIPSLGSASPPGQEFVPEGTAREVALAKIDHLGRTEDFAEWRGATAGPARTYRAKNGGKGPEYLPSAHVFPVQKRGSVKGYVTIGADRRIAPVVEYSKADPPGTGLDEVRTAARGQGATESDRYLYQGGVQYGLELSDGTVANLRNGKVYAENPGMNPDAMVAGDELTREKWADVEDELDGSGRSEAGVAGGASTADGASVLSHDDSDEVWGVPCWTEEDDGGAGSTEVGTGPDTWNDWDGCVPVAASMVVGYHEWVWEGDAERRETIIDRLHRTMNTSVDGQTYPWNVDDGFEDYHWGWNDYDARNIYVWTYPDFEKTEIANYRPFLLNVFSGGEAEDRSQNYGDHSVTVVGYRDGGATLKLHDTWGYDPHYLAWGSWLAANYTKVTTD